MTRTKVTPDKPAETKCNLCEATGWTKQWGYARIKLVGDVRCELSMYFCPDHGELREQAQAMVRFMTELRFLEPLPSAKNKP